MALRTSNPPSYDNIFAIRRGATADYASLATLPGHRGLYIATSAIVEVTFTNLDGTTSLVRFPSGVSLVLPLQIKSYTTPSTGSSALYLYGLV
jgi:hypothetical protein